MCRGVPKPTADRTACECTRERLWHCQAPLVPGPATCVDGTTCSDACKCDTDGTTVCPCLRCKPRKDGLGLPEATTSVTA
jgi:hypothetical protein